MSFVDRTEAGRRLAEALDAYAGKEAVVLALPRGGVPVAAEVASRLGAPLDLLIVRKIGVPYQPELAMGAVVDGEAPVVVRNEDVIRQADLSQAEFDRVRDHELAEIERRRERYLAGRQPVDIAGRTAIVIDDGIATGATVRAAIRGLRRKKPAEIVLAVPVAPPDTVAMLETEADRVVCLEQPSFFQAIGLHYRDFRQVSDEEVIATLAAFPPAAAKGAGEAKGQA
jgi:predicted phosphoribosyltransferase